MHPNFKAAQAINPDLLASTAHFRPISRVASDKASAAEVRSKQKVLALQEAVKQSLAATNDAKAEASTIEKATSALRLQEDELELQVTRLREEAARIKAQADDSVAADAKRLAGHHGGLRITDGRWV